MPYEKIHIDEEKKAMIWVLLACVAIALAVFLFFNALFIGGLMIVKLIIGLILIGIAGYAVRRFSSPIYHFDLSIHDSNLIIEISRSDDLSFDKQIMPLSEINSLRIAPHTPRSRSEALFDFSTNYYLLYRNDEEVGYQRLIYPDGQLFTFKVKDIRKIIGFLANHDNEIQIPPDHELFME